MSRLQHQALLFAALLAGCKAEPPSAEMAVYEPAPAPAPPAPIRQACEGNDREFAVISNGWGHGSSYFGLISRCSEGIRLGLDLWSAKEATFDFSANQCPQVPSQPLEHGIPAVDDRRGKLQAELKRTRSFLKNRFSEFKARCGVPAESGKHLLDGFEEFYADQLKIAWIHNDYIDRLGRKGRLGWGDAKLKKEAIEAYAQTH